MADETIPHRFKYFVEFDRHTKDIDEVAQVLLKGHLVIESALDNIIGLIFFHPEYALDARLSFNQKAQLARAYCVRRNTSRAWGLIFALNSLRNEIAHSLTGGKREKKLEALRRMFFVDADPSLIEDVKRGPEFLIVSLTCGESIGFLTWFEGDLKELRHKIDALNSVPAEERAAPKV